MGSTLHEWNGDLNASKNVEELHFGPSHASSPAKKKKKEKKNPPGAFTLEPLGLWRIEPGIYFTAPTETDQGALHACQDARHKYCFDLTPSCEMRQVLQNSLSSFKAALRSAYALHGDSLSMRISMEQPCSDEAPSVQPSDACLVNLPTELKMAIASHLRETKDLCQLRLVCRDLEASVRDVFARRSFVCIKLLPTADALNQLLAFAKNERLRHYARELNICDAVYRFEVKARRPEIIDSDRYPYPVPALAWQQAANDAVTFLWSGGLQKQLTVALLDLRIECIKIYNYTKWMFPPASFGSRQLVQQTGKEQDPQQSLWGAWDYASPNLVTSVANAVFTAVTESRTPLSSLTVDKVQVDRIEIFQPPSSDSSNSILQNMKQLNVRNEHPRHLRGLPEEHITSPSHHDRLVESLTSISRLPNLEHLYMSLPSNVEHMASLKDVLLSKTTSKRLRTLDLGIFGQPMPELIPFLSNMRPQDLTLCVRIQYWRDQKEAALAPWKQFLPLLGAVSFLHRLDINILGSNQFKGYRADGIKRMLADLVESRLSEATRNVLAAPAPSYEYRYTELGPVDSRKLWDL